MTSKEEFIVGKYPAELLLDILTTAVESWSYMWGQCERYKWMWWYLPDPTDPTDVLYPQVVNEDKVKPDTTLLKYRDMHEETGEKPGDWVEITLEKLAAGTDWALENYNHLYSWHTNNSGIRDDIDYDAVGADAILQKIVLDGVIYG